MELCRLNFPEPLIIIPRTACLSFTSPQYPREPIWDLFILHYRPNSQNALTWAIIYMSHERCVAKHQTKIVRDDWLSFTAEEDQHKSVEVSMWVCICVCVEPGHCPSQPECLKPFSLSHLNGLLHSVWLPERPLSHPRGHPPKFRYSHSDRGWSLSPERVYVGTWEGQRGGREEREAGQHNIISVNMWKEGTEVRV